MVHLGIRLLRRKESNRFCELWAIAAGRPIRGRLRDVEIKTWRHVKVSCMRWFPRPGSGTLFWEIGDMLSWYQSSVLHVQGIPILPLDDLHRESAGLPDSAQPPAKTNLSHRPGALNKDNPPTRTRPNSVPSIIIEQTKYCTAPMIYLLLIDWQCSCLKPDYQVWVVDWCLRCWILKVCVQFWSLGGRSTLSWACKKQYCFLVFYACKVQTHTPLFHEFCTCHN